jgi:hypothetical protein
MPTLAVTSNCVLRTLLLHHYLKQQQHVPHYGSGFEVKGWIIMSVCMCEHMHTLATTPDSIVGTVKHVYGICLALSLPINYMITTQNFLNLKRHINFRGNILHHRPHAVRIYRQQ